jgi:hypothetical protein
MTSESASQSISPDRTDDVLTSWDERTVLTTFLDYARDTVHAKCAGLSDADARRAPLPGSPLMTISGLVSHLRWVESSWFEARMLGGVIDAPWTDDDPDREFRIAVEVPLSQLLAEYRAACTRHRQLVASLDLDAPSAGALAGGPSPSHCAGSVPPDRGDCPAQRPHRHPPRTRRWHARKMTAADRLVRSPVGRAPSAAAPPSRPGGDGHRLA